VQNLSKIELGSVEGTPAPRTGKVGYLDHPRLGLIGSVACWARGGMAHAVTMIVALTVKLGITERVRNALPETDAETNAKIVDLLKAGLAETKHCTNEQQHIQYLIGLSYVMLARAEQNAFVIGLRCALLHHQMSRRARASSLPTLFFFLARPATLLCEHTVAGVTHVRACAGGGMGQSLPGEGP